MNRLPVGLIYKVYYRLLKLLHLLQKFDLPKMEYLGHTPLPPYPGRDGGGKAQTNRGT